jgi:hypothetical protein
MGDRSDISLTSSAVRFIRRDCSVAGAGLATANKEDFKVFIPHGLKILR